MGHEGALAALARRGPAGTAAALLADKEVGAFVRAVVRHLAAAAAAAPRPAPHALVAIAHALGAVLDALAAHGDPSLLTLATGPHAATDAALIAHVLGMHTTALPALCPDGTRAAHLGAAAAVLQRADAPPAAAARAARIATALVSVPTPLADRGARAALADALTHAYRVPSDSAWDAAKAELVCAADAVSDADAADMAGGGADHDHVTTHTPLRTLALGADLRGARARAFAGPAWARVAQTLTHTHARVDHIELVLAILPHLDPAAAVRRLARPQYARMRAEEVLEAFIDDPHGVRDADDGPRMRAVPAADAHADEALTDDLKAAIVARATEEETPPEEWLPDTRVDGASDADASRAQRILVQHWAEHGAPLFARTRDARAGAARAALRAALEPLGRWGDDQIEGWGVMFARSARRDAALDAARAELVPNMNHASGPDAARFGPDRMRGGRVRGESSGRGRGAQQRGRGRARGRARARPQG